MEDFAAVLSGLVSVSSSICFYIFSRNQNSIQKWIGASHGFLFIMALGYAVLISSVTSHADHSVALWVFFALILMGFVSMIFTLRYMHIYRWLCLFHVYNFFYGLGVLFIGLMYISHDWL